MDTPINPDLGLNVVKTEANAIEPQPQLSEPIFDVRGIEEKKDFSMFQKPSILLSYKQAAVQSSENVIETLATAWKSEPEVKLESDKHINTTAVTAQNEVCLSKMQTKDVNDNFEDNQRDPLTDCKTNVSNGMTKTTLEEDHRVGKPTHSINSDVDKMKAILVKHNIQKVAVPIGEIRQKLSSTTQDEGTGMNWMKQHMWTDSDSGSRTPSSEITSGIVKPRKYYIENCQTNVHKRADTKEKPYSCDVCGKRFVKTYNLSKHVEKAHTEDKRAECDVCGKCFNSANSVALHKRVHKKFQERDTDGQNKSQEHDSDGKSFKQKWSLTLNMKTHSKDQSYKCDVCGKCYNRTELLTKHMQSHTSKKEGAKHTGNVKTVKSTKKDHKEGAESYECDICTRKFKLKQYLSRHMTSHTGVKPYKCNVCGKLVRCPSNLAKHKRIHTGERPYKCQTCGKSFSQATHLTVHKRIHTGEKPHQCHICGYRTGDISCMPRHMRLHTNEKPFKCDVCGKRSHDASNMAQHKRTHLLKRRTK